MFCQGFHLFKAVHKSLEVFPNNVPENPGSLFFETAFWDKWHLYCHFIALVLFFYYLCRRHCPNSSGPGSR